MNADEGQQRVSTLLLFGSAGTLGQSIRAKFQCSGWGVFGASHQNRSSAEICTQDSLWIKKLESQKVSFDAVVWAQGLNLTDSVFEFDRAQQLNVLEANLTYTIQTMGELVKSELLLPNCRFTILNSVWATLSRRRKLSYMISKSGTSGLVRSAAADLRSIGISVNAISPGVVDSPMAERFLSQESLDDIREMSAGGRLVTPDEVAQAVFWLSGREASGINGQEIVVDRGWGLEKHVEA